MLIAGCDYHPSFQQIAWVDTESGECGEQPLMHSTGEAEMFYRKLKEQGVKVRRGYGCRMWTIAICGSCCGIVTGWCKCERE